MGRLSTYTPEAADRICALAASGQSMRLICSADDMPECSTVFKWLRENDEFSEQYARAKHECADHLAEAMLEIADDTNGDPQRDRLRVDTRKWIASKLKPKKYGEMTKLEHTGADGAALTLAIANAADLRKQIRGGE